MKLTWVALGLALGQVLGAAAYAAAPAPMSAEQVVARSVEAQGGAAAWRAVRTLSMSGLLDAGQASPDVDKLVEESRRAPGRPHKRLHAEAPKPDQPGRTEAEVIRLPYLIELRRPNQMRVELKVKDSTAIQVWDGVRGWKLRPWLGRHEVEEYTPEEVRLASRQQPLDGPLVDYAAKGSTLKAEGRETVDGKDCYKLAVTLKSGDVLTVWVDAQTFLIDQLGSIRSYGGKQRMLLTRMRDYRKVDGLMIPFQLEDQVRGVRGVQHIEIQQVAVNPPLPDGHFTRPQ